MIYEAVDRVTGEVLAAFDALDDAKAGFRLRYELGSIAWETDTIRMHRADQAKYPQVGCAQFHWLPEVRHGQDRNRG